MKSFDFWQRWLQGVFGLLVAMGVAMAVVFLLLPTKPVSDPVIAAFWPRGDISPAAAAFHSWIFGVWGATLAGWALLMIFVIRHPFRKRERWSWVALWTALALWYPIDTYVSIHFNVHFNAVLNTAILLLVAIPLLATRRHFAAELG